jgi:NAD(P)H dehydrogenase (quinone)
MRVLVVYAHPVETSFVAALHRTVVNTLSANGHEVDDCDLYAENFQPVLTREERIAYHDVPSNRAPVDRHVERLLRAEAFIIVCPIWNFGLPAILKGYFDRVFIPGVSFRLDSGVVSPSLTNIKHVAMITTYGAVRWRAFLIGDPPRKLGKWFLWSVFRTRRPPQFLALYDMNNATQEKREAFVERVRVAMTRL